MVYATLGVEYGLSLGDAYLMGSAATNIASAREERFSPKSKLYEFNPDAARTKRKGAGMYTSGRLRRDLLAINDSIRVPNLLQDSRRAVADREIERQKEMSLFYSH